MARNDFIAKTQALEQMVGDGKLTGTFAVNGGARTIPLEVGYWVNHMGRNGRVDIRNWTEGGPHAAQNSLEATWERSLQDIAASTLHEGPQEAMKRHVESVAEEFKKRAPKRTGAYRDSTARIVTDNGVPTHEAFDAHFGEDPNG